MATIDDAVRTKDVDRLRPLEERLAVAIELRYLGM